MRSDGPAASLATRVQLRSDPATVCRLLYGTPEAMGSGIHGPIAFFPPDSLVAYHLEFDRKERVFVFRTLEGRAPDTSEVPGVFPAVNLLMEVRSRGRVDLVRRLFAYLALTGRQPEALSEGFFVRANTLLAGQLPRRRVLEALLQREENKR